MKREKEFYERVQREVLVPALDKLALRRGELAELAVRLERHGMAHARNRLAELRNGKRTLTFFFLKLLIDGGVMTAEQIMAGRSFNDLNNVEKDIVLRLEADNETLLLLHEIKAKGMNPVAFLKAIIGKN